jgi:hypothetical protein
VFWHHLTGNDFTGVNATCIARPQFRTRFHYTTRTRLLSLAASDVRAYRFSPTGETLSTKPRLYSTGKEAGQSVVHSRIIFFVISRLLRRRYYILLGRALRKRWDRKAQIFGDLHAFRFLVVSPA